MLLILATALRVFGLIQYAIQIEQIIEAKRKSQAVANIPVTKEEITDAADSGTL